MKDLYDNIYNIFKRYLPVKVDKKKLRLALIALSALMAVKSQLQNQVGNLAAREIILTGQKESLAVSYPDGGAVLKAFSVTTVIN